MLGWLPFVNYLLLCRAPSQFQSCTHIIKYIKMAASSNFGNMFSVVGASVFLPFLPMLPIQLLTNNLLYDFSQIAIPSDEVDRDWLIKPRQWTSSRTWISRSFRRSRHSSCSCSRERSTSSSMASCLAMSRT